MFDMWQVLSRQVYNLDIFNKFKSKNSFIILGRGIKSHAYTHSVQQGHHVYINLSTLKFYCLPDNYEVIDSSLDDIKVGNCYKS